MAVQWIVDRQCASVGQAQDGQSKRQFAGRGDREKAVLRKGSPGVIDTDDKVFSRTVVPRNRDDEAGHRPGCHDLLDNGLHPRLPIRRFLHSPSNHDATTTLSTSLQWSLHRQTK